MGYERYRLGGYSYYIKEGYTVYSYAFYLILEDGTLLFSRDSSYNPSGVDIRPTSLASYLSSCMSSNHVFRDVNGNQINLILDDNARMGIFFNVDNLVPSQYPKTVQSISDSDFVTNIGGVEIVNGIPRTGIENILGSAIGMGLIAADAPLTIGADGTITKADGIPVDKLGEILEAIQSGNLNLDSIEEYLTLISTLVGNGNLTMTEQQKILENVNANTKAGAKDLAKIREAIDELTKEYEWEAEDEDTDKEISWITAEHTGLKEAKDFVSNIEFVNQSTELLGNLFGKYERADSQAPKFSFYWDSDKEGELEKYTVLDLSFMEQRLTNANIDDKRRFQNGMTIRGFVRYLIVFLS